MFDIEGKIALITGGASGLGLAFAKALLKNGLQGVTLADINDDFGHNAIKEIDSEFGKNKAIYVKTDVSNYQQFDNAFNETVLKFKNIDILINNAGIMDDFHWEKEVAVNLNGTINGILLGLENYIPKYRSGPEGVIINISSVAGFSVVPPLPIYKATKSAVIGLTISFGHQAHYKRTNVKILALCPGYTQTGILNNLNQQTIGEAYSKLLRIVLKNNIIIQKPDCLGPIIVKLIQEKPSASIWVAEDDKELYEFIPNERQILD